MSFFGAFDAFTDQSRARKAGVEDGVPLLLQPFLQQPNLSRAAHAIGPLHNNQLADEIVEVQARQLDAVVFLHGATRSCFACVSFARTSRRISCCCVSMGSVASIAVSPNSGIIFSYSSRIRL